MRALIFAPLLLVACVQGLTLTQEVAVACRGYAATLSAVTPFKGQMSASQKAAIDNANAIVIPACHSASLGGVVEAGTLSVVRNHLRTMLVIERNVKETGA